MVVFLTVAYIALTNLLIKVKLLPNTRRVKVSPGAILMNKMAINIIVGCGFLFLSSTLHAQSLSSVYSGLQDFSDLLLPEGSIVTLGLGPQYTPDYAGSNDYRLKPNVTFHLRLGNTFRFNSDGVSINILDLKGFRFGPVINISGGRDESSNSALAGLGDLGASVDLGIFMKWIIQEKFSARLRYRRSIISGTGGGIFDAQITTILYKKDNFSVGLGARGSWIDSSLAQQFFGITPEQAANSGLPIFEIGGVPRDIRLSASTRWELNEQWAFNVYGEYTKLLGAVADSPLIADFGSSNQYTIGVNFARTFKWE